MSRFTLNRMIRPSTILSWCSGHQWHFLSTIQTPLRNNHSSSLSQASSKHYRQPNNPTPTSPVHLIFHTSRTWNDILAAATERGKRKLVNTEGFVYAVKRPRPTGVVNWWCSRRNDHVRCRGTVTQKYDSFKRGVNEHCHPPVPGVKTAPIVKVRHLHHNIKIH